MLAEADLKLLIKPIPSTTSAANICLGKGNGTSTVTERQLSEGIKVSGLNTFQLRTRYSDPEGSL